MTWLLFCTLIKCHSQVNYHNLFIVSIWTTCFSSKAQGFYSDGSFFSVNHLKWEDDSSRGFLTLKKSSPLGRNKMENGPPLVWQSQRIGIRNDIQPGVRVYSASWEEKKHTIWQLGMFRCWGGDQNASSKYGLRRWLYNATTNIMLVEYGS